MDDGLVSELEHSAWSMLSFMGRGPGDAWSTPRHGW